jgi:hypothetical protein
LLLKPSFCLLFDLTMALHQLPRVLASHSLLLLLLAVYAASANIDACECGYRDNIAGLSYTESIITYFNETGLEDHDFVAQSYTHRSENSWNALYRQGAAPKNAVWAENSNETALSLFLDAPTLNHIVVGSGIQSRRQDIIFGTFRALVRSPPKSVGGGSVLTMSAEFDETESVNMNMMNTNSPSTAWLSTLMRGEFPSSELGSTYQMIAAVDRTDPWDFIELRFDWNTDEVRYFVQGNLTRAVPKRQGRPRSPAPFFFRHWSTGDKYSSQGPPAHRTSAEVKWGRLFFNSSLMTPELHKAYDKRCRAAIQCSVDDWTLRGSSPYDPRALLSWKLVKPKPRKRIAAIVISSASVALTVILIIHTLLHRKPWKKTKPARNSMNSEYSHSITSPSAGILTPPTAPSYDGFRDSRTQLGPTGSAYEYAPTHPSVEAENSLNGVTLRDINRVSEYETSDVISAAPIPSIPGMYDGAKTTKKAGQQVTIKFLISEENLAATKATKGKDAIPESSTASPILDFATAPDRNTSSIAGLLAICALSISAVDFALTFSPAVIESFVASHYDSEGWARKTIVPFLISFVWVAPFITTSVRAIATPYLRGGDLREIACKAVEQTPRLMIPIAIVTLIEYFLINAGITTWLKNLSSLSWSEWPYTSTYSNFADWITELLELMYIMPNAAPSMTFHYCTGVLWLIPVLLQFSWTVLLGIVVIHEIKTPWKRSIYYAFALVTNWYAQSWGTFLWVGLLLVDLDITYDYKRILSNRPWLHYGTLSVFVILVLLGGIADMVPEWANYNFSTIENNIHPDSSSALAIGSTQNAGFPQYYVPRLSGLAFAVGLHGIVEISPWAQMVFTTKLVARLSPHALTIYLVHGMIFWSWGAWLAVFLSGTIGLPYWAVLIIVALTSYVLVGFTLPIFTPMLGTLERNLTALVWHVAVSEPPKKRETIFPFDQSFIKEYETRPV